MKKSRGGATTTATTSSIMSKHSDLIAHLSGLSNNSQSRRPIRILHNSAMLPPDHEVFQQLQQTNDLLNERHLALKTLRSHTKQSNMTNLLKTEWKEEHERLNNLRSKLEKTMGGFFQMMIVHSNQLTVASSMLSTTANNALPGHGNVGNAATKMIKTGLGNSLLEQKGSWLVSGSSSSGNGGNSGGSEATCEICRQDITFIINTIDSLLYEEEKFTTDRVALRSSYQSQLKEIKRIISNAEKSLQQSSSKTEAPSEQQAAAVRGVLADLFLSMRCDHSKTWQSLRQQEESLKSDVAKLDRQIHEMLKSETIKKQDEYLQVELLKLLTTCIDLNQIPKNDKEVNRSPRKSPRSPRSSKCASPRNNFELQATTGSKANNATSSAAEHDEETDFMSSIFASDLETSSVLQTDPDLFTILESYFHQIQHVDMELSHLRDQNSMEVSQLHVDLELDSATPLGGWTQDSHDTFVKIYRKATLTGMPRKKMLEVLTNALPDESHERILSHEEFVRGMKRIANKFKQMEQTQIVKRQELMIQLSKEVHEYNEEKKERIRYEQQLQQHEEKRMLIHERLESLRQEKIMVDEEKRIQDLLKAEEDDKQQLLRLQQLESERLERNKRLSEYRDKKRKLLEQQNLQMEQERERMAEELRTMIAENRSKVELRAHKLMEKNLERKLKEEEMHAEEQRKIAALLKLAEQVPYFENIQDMESRLDHITASVRGHQYIESEEEGTRGHLPLNGFTDTKVISDTRFRLAEAFRMAGVANSSAARDMVQKYHPRPHLAIHGIL